MQCYNNRVESGGGGMNVCTVVLCVLKELVFHKRSGGMFHYSATSFRYIVEIACFIYWSRDELMRSLCTGGADGKSAVSRELEGRERQLGRR